MPKSFYCVQVNRSPKDATERLLQKTTYFSNNFVNETQNLIAKQSQNRHMNAPVFPLHLGKQVTQGCNREITPKKLNSVMILVMKLKT